VPERVFYRLLPGTDVIPVGDDVVLASDGVTLRLEGDSATLFRDRVLPLLDGTRSLAEVSAAIPGVAAGDLRRHLDALVVSRVLGRQDAPHRTDDDAGLASPLLRFIDAVGLSPAEAATRLAALRVAVFGLEGPGAYLASGLVASGVGTVLLVDPYPCQPADVAAMLALSAVDGASRQEVVRSALQAQGTDATLEVGGEAPLDRAGVAALAADCDLVVGCFDKGFSATNVWLNDAALALDTDALYATLRGPTAWVGPLVVPHETACWLCWRMRAIACDDDFNASMAIEEFRDGQRRPALHEGGTIPALAQMVGGLMGLEAVKHLLGLGRGTLAGHVQEIDALAGRFELHGVLAVPDCPACKKKSPRELILHSTS